MSGAGVWRREKFLLRGREPEKALQRLKNAGIVLFDVKKNAKRRPYFLCKRKTGAKSFCNLSENVV